MSWASFIADTTFRYIDLNINQGGNQELDQLEGGVVGAVREEEDAGHLDGGVALHLLKQGLQVDALGRPEVELCHWAGCLKQRKF